ncbi:MAG: 6-phosphogluconolactonase [Gemmatimonadales bacterium]
MRGHVEVLASADSLADAAARRFVAAAEGAMASRGEFIVALAGGATPRLTYARLAEPSIASRVDWTRVQVLWGDERCVPPDDEASNYRMAREALLDHVNVRESNVHRIHGEEHPVAAASAYEAQLRSLLRTPQGAPRVEGGRRIDLVLLGLGADGHTASLFPGVAAGSARWVVAVRAPGASLWRVTLTPPIINAAAAIVFIVSGDAKAEIVHRVLDSPQVPAVLPAQRIAPEGRVHWMLDEAAAARLRGVVTP